MTSNQHILIVDDQPDNILILDRTLHRAGYVVSGVRSGQAALDFVAHTLPAFPAARATTGQREERR